MPTSAQRAASIVGAILNKTATVNQRQRILAAFGEMVPPPSANTDNIAAYFINYLRREILNVVREYEARDAINTARVVGVDVARHGDDASVILKRLGLGRNATGAEVKAAIITYIKNMVQMQEYDDQQRAYVATPIDPS